MPYPQDHRQETREKILASARRLFNRNGLSEVSIDAVMAGAGLTRGGFYSYFDSKDELYAEAITAFTRRFPSEPWQCSQGMPPPADRPLCNTFDRERSGDLYYLPARGWIMDTQDEPAATAHGSIHEYDREVPLIILAPGRKPHDAQTSPSGTVAMETVAPLLASWLGVKL